MRRFKIFLPLSVFKRLRNPYFLFLFSVFGWYSLPRVLKRGRSAAKSGEGERSSGWNLKRTMIISGMECWKKDEGTYRAERVERERGEMVLVWVERIVLWLPLVERNLGGGIIKCAIPERAGRRSEGSWRDSRQYWSHRRWCGTK